MDNRKSSHGIYCKNKSMGKGRQQRFLGKIWNRDVVPGAYQPYAENGYIVTVITKAVYYPLKLHFNEWGFRLPAILYPLYREEASYISFKLSQNKVVLLIPLCKNQVYLGNSKNMMFSKTLFFSNIISLSLFLLYNVCMTNDNCIFEGILAIAMC